MEPTGRRRGLVVTAITLLAAAAILGSTAAAAPGMKTGPIQSTATASWIPSGKMPTVPTTTVPLVTTTTVPAVPTITEPPATPAAVPAVAPAPAPVSAEPPGYGCAAALAYLAANANPEFTFECPGNADGNAAMTCINSALCPGEHLIAIADPCPAAYMNEAYNSNNWSDVLGAFTRPIDPYGEC